MWIRIVDYREFYDVPRMFVVERSGSLLLFDCPFDADLDAYPPQYSIYRLPHSLRHAFPDDWTQLPSRATTCLGTIRLSEIEFDASKRAGVVIKGIDALLLDDEGPARPTKLDQ